MNDQAKDYMLQGFALMGSANFKEAQRLFQKALECDDCAELWLNLGNSYASGREYDKALDAFTNALSLEPNNGEILFNIGSVYLLQEKLKQCIEYYNRAEEAGFDNARLYINLAAIYKALDDPQMELRNYTKAIRKDPLIESLYVNKATLLLDMGQPEAALNVLEDMHQLFPDSFEGYDLTSKIYLAQGDAKKALEILETGINKFPKDFNLKLSKANMLVQEKDIDQAETILKELKKDSLAELYTRNILMLEVSIASRKNQPEQMEKILTEIVKKEQNQCDEEARFMLMMTSNLLKDYHLALKQAECLDKQESGSIYAISGMYYKGELLLKLGKINEAETQFKKATKKLRKLSMSARAPYTVYIFRSLAHKQLKEYDKAIELAQFITEVQPDKADGYVILADIYKDMGDDDKSKQAYSIALKKNPDLEREVSENGRKLGI